MLEYLSMDEELQFKYNKHIQEIKTLTYDMLPITNYFLPPKPSNGQTNATILDLGRPITKEELEYIKNSNEFNKENILFIRQPFGVSLHISSCTEFKEFQYNCTQIAIYLNIKIGKPMSIVFCNTAKRNKDKALETTEDVIEDEQDLYYVHNTYGLFSFSFADRGLMISVEEQREINSNGVEMISINKGNGVTKY